MLGIFSQPHRRLQREKCVKKNIKRSRYSAVHLGYVFIPTCFKFINGNSIFISGHYVLHIHIEKFNTTLDLLLFGIFEHIFSFFFFVGLIWGGVGCGLLFVSFFKRSVSCLSVLQYEQVLI